MCRLQSGLWCRDNSIVLETSGCCNCCSLTPRDAAGYRLHSPAAAVGTLLVAAASDASCSVEGLASWVQSRAVFSPDSVVTGPNDRLQPGPGPDQVMTAAACTLACCCIRGEDAMVFYEDYGLVTQADFWKLCHHNIPHHRQSHTRQDSGSG